MTVRFKILQIAVDQCPAQLTVTESIYRPYHLFVNALHLFRKSSGNGLVVVAFFIVRELRFQGHVPRILLEFEIVESRQREIACPHVAV